MAERSALQVEYAYEIEFDDGTDYAHYYYTNKIDADSPSLFRFDPLYELGQEIDRAISGQTILIPYFRIVKILKRIESD